MSTPVGFWRQFASRARRGIDQLGRMNTSIERQSGGRLSKKSLAVVEVGKEVKFQ